MESAKKLAKNHKAIECDNCKLWVHLKCNKINVQTYKLLQNDHAAWFCLTCSKTIFPFSELNEEELCSTIQGKKIKFVAVS